MSSLRNKVGFVFLDQDASFTDDEIFVIDKLQKLRLHGYHIDLSRLNVTGEIKFEYRLHDNPVEDWKNDNDVHKELDKLLAPVKILKLEGKNPGWDATLKYKGKTNFKLYIEQIPF